MTDDPRRPISRRDEVDEPENWAAEGDDSDRDVEPTRNGLPHWADWAPSRLKLWLCLGPIIGIPLIVTPTMWIGRAYLVANHPQILLMLSSNWVNMGIAIVKMGAVSFLVVTIVRRMIFVPCYFFLGRWGGDRGLEWMAKNSPPSARVLERLTRWFPRYGPLLVMFYPNRIVFVLAGASTMRFGVFLAFSLVGAALYPALLYWSTFYPPIERVLASITQFFEDYTWQITVASLVIVFAISIISELRNPDSQLRNLNKLEEEVEDSIEAEEQERRHP